MRSPLDTILRKASGSDVGTVQAVAERILADGKRVRPRFTEAVASALGIESADSRAVGVAAELLHNATLLHDDVIDASERRRGHVAAHVEFGTKQAVLTGDFLIARSIEVLADAQCSVAVAELGPFLRKAVEAEVLQAELAFNASATLDQSRRIAEGKTGALFGWCARSVGRLAGLAGAKVEALGTVGTKYGLAFQLGDDLLDFVDCDIGKPLRKDLEEGYLSVPVQLLRSAEGHIDSLIRKVFAHSTDGDVGNLYRELLASGVIAIGREEQDRLFNELALELTELFGHNRAGRLSALLLELLPKK